MVHCAYEDPGPASSEAAHRPWRAAGLSTRAIGSALRVGKSTVERDLATVLDGSVEVQSLDGRTRPATQPARPASPWGFYGRGGTLLRLQVPVRR